MSENTHHARATSRLHNGTTNEVARAQAEATLALAYEQRTANLIAFYGDGPVGTAGDPAYAELNRQIVERLGLA
jgi:hypothetical protein